MYGLIGKKLGHSYSASFFNNKFRKEGIEETYELLPIENIQEITNLLERYPDLKGLNVTIPYKEDVISFLNEVSAEAKEIGAVNVIKVNRSKENIILKGYNTDVTGFRMSLQPLLRDDIKKALILGTGGASKAVDHVLKRRGIQTTFVSRNPNDSQLSYQGLTKEIIKNNLLIVNTTPLGMYPKIEEAPEIPYHYLTSRHVCFDLIYNPEETLFMQKAEYQGATVKNGLEMLEQQALAAWDIWKNN